jgi:hypothetical protein
MKLLKYENDKLKDQYIFNLPVSKEVCGRECPGCYALKAQKRFPKTVLPYREARLDASKRKDFVSTIVSELKTYKRTADVVRIHESGEFYSQEYINKWEAIAKALPNFRFYAFTKRIKEFNFKKIMSLPNVVIIDSLMHGGLNYDKIEKLNKSIKICPATVNSGIKCDEACGYCWSKEAQTNGIQFVKH